MIELFILILPFVIAMMIIAFIILLIHVSLFTYICIFGPHTLRVIVITLHVVWFGFYLRDGKLYGYHEIFGKPNKPSMSERGVTLIMSWNIYHSAVSKRYKNEYHDKIDNARGPFELGVWGEKEFSEEFPTERWALQRLYQILEMDKTLTYEEMWHLYKQKWGDKLKFRISASEYEYKKEII